MKKKNVPTEEVLNFHWHIKNFLATGGKPSRSEQLNWLKEKGFQAIVSLELFSANIFSDMVAAGINHLWLDLDADSQTDFDPYKIEPRIWEKFYAFITNQLDQGHRVFVHCSAGINRSFKLVQRYLNETANLRQT